MRGGGGGGRHQRNKRKINTEYFVMSAAKIRVFDSENDVSSELCNFIISKANDAIKRNDAFFVGVSGVHFYYYYYYYFNISMSVQKRERDVAPESVVRAFAHGAMGPQIDPSWGGPKELFLVSASAPRLV